MDNVKDGLEQAGRQIGTFLPKLLGFLLILVIGYFIAKAVTKLLEKVLERVGFDKAVERGGIKKALANSKYDASSLLAQILFFILFLFVLQLAFSVFGPNPISDLIEGVISYLPNIFVAIVIIVVGASIAAVVKELIEAALGGLSYGKALAFGASAAILVLAAFAALDQLKIAEDIVQTLFTALVFTIGAILVVAVGGGGIKTMSQYWDRWSSKLEQEKGNIKQEAQGATERIQERAQERKEQIQGGTSGGSSSTSELPQSGGYKPSPGTAK
jgi:small-conductance mechanosensitive channel